MINRFIKQEEKQILREESQLKKTDMSEAQRKEKEVIYERRKELLEKVSCVDILGRMVIELDDLNKFKGAKSDISIEDGDTLYVPASPSSVQIVGSVYNPTSVIYKEGQSLEYYLQKVGGATKHADRKNIYIVRANGEVNSKYVRLQELGRGDTIVVPEEFKTKTAWGKLWLDTSQVMYHLAVGAAVIID